MSNIQPTIAATAAPFAQPNRVVAAIHQLDVIRGNVSKAHKTIVIGRTQLYKEMGDTLVVFRNDFLDASAEEQTVFLSHITAALKSDGVKIQKDSKPLPLFVKYVFKVNRQGANKYAGRLQKAQDLMVPDAKIAEYLAGKMENEFPSVKKQKAQKGLSPTDLVFVTQAKQKVEANILSFGERPMATVAFTNQHMEGDYVVLLAKPTNDGTCVSVVASLNHAPAALVSSLKAELVNVEFERLQAAHAIDHNVYTGNPLDFSVALDVAATTPLTYQANVAERFVPNGAEQSEPALA